MGKSESFRFLRKILVSSKWGKWRDFGAKVYISEVAQSGVNGAFLGPKSTFLKFPSNPFIKFF